MSCLQRISVGLRGSLPLAAVTSWPESISSLGAQIPPEVVRNIVYSLCQPPSYLKKSWTWKKGLAACSLTCRYWSRILRPVLFKCCTLYTPEDISLLLSFFESPVCVGPALTTCISLIEYKIRESQIPPWIRLHKLSRLIPNTTIILNVNGSPPPSTLAFRGPSLLKDFPRTLPPSIFQFANEVTIENIHFNRVTDFSPLFHNIAKVRDGQCTNLTVQHGIEQIPLPRPALSRRQRVEDCILFGISAEIGANDFSTQFALACTLVRPADRLQLDHTTWSSAADIITSVVPPRFRISSLWVDGGGMWNQENCRA